MTSTSEHGEAVTKARAAFESDERVLALWIEGSVARGTADPWSDVDLHLAIADGQFDQFVADSESLLSRIERPLGYLQNVLPGLRLLPATLEGPVRLDLYVERREAVSTIPRQPEYRMLFDRDDVSASLSAAPALVFDPRAQLETLMRGYFFGGMWPRRMIGRGDWGALLMNATGVIYQFVVPAMLIADRSPEFYREPHNRERFLSPSRRDQLNALLGKALAAWRGIDESGPDVKELSHFHAELLALLWRSFRDACAASGADYPEAAESAYREYFHRELGIEVAATSV